MFCPTVNLYSAAWVQFAASLVLLAPLAFVFEGAKVNWSWALFGSIAFLVVLASIFAVVLEYLMFGVAPSALTLVGIAVTCLGVSLVTAGKLRQSMA